MPAIKHAHTGVTEDDAGWVLAIEKEMAYTPDVLNTIALEMIGSEVYETQTRESGVWIRRDYRKLNSKNRSWRTH